MPSIHKAAFAVLLAGGKSSRMNRDKALLRVGGDTLLDYQLQNITPVAQRTLISRNDEQNYHIKDFFVQAGPMAGIHACIEYLKNHELEDINTDLLVVPVDMPLVTPMILSKLIRYGQINKTACYFEKNVLPIYIPNMAKAYDEIDQLLKDEIKLLNTFLDIMSANAITCDNPDLLVNANTPMQWKVISRKLNRKLNNF